MILCLAESLNSLARLSRSLIYKLAYGGRTYERDTLDVGMVEKNIYLVPRTCYNIDNAVGNACLLVKLRDTKRGSRSKAYSF